MNPISGFSNTYLSYRYIGYIVAYEISRGFEFSASSADPPTLVFTFSDVRNPRTIQTTGAFGATIYDSNANILYSWN